jgi:hypothetical protein
MEKLQRREHNAIRQIEESLARIGAMAVLCVNSLNLLLQARASAKKRNRYLMFWPRRMFGDI